MPKLKEQDGSIVFVSNGLRAVALDEDGHGEILTVVLPEGVRLFVVPSDNGLIVRADEDEDERCLYVNTVRIKPKPTLENADGSAPTEDFDK